MRSTMACMILLGTAVTWPAIADDAGLYVAASLGRVDGPNNGVLGVGPQPLTGKIDDGNFSWSASLGYRLNQYFAIDLGYVDLGELEADVSDATRQTDGRASVSFSAEGVSVAMIAGLPLGRWRPYLKGGVLFTNTELAYAGTGSGTRFSGRFTNDVEDALYGIGVDYALNSDVYLSLDATYVEVGTPSRGKADLLNTSLGVTWKF